jgi:hypothetical protein
MRVLLVLLALVAAPFMTGVSQGRGHDADVRVAPKKEKESKAARHAEHCAKRLASHTKHHHKAVKGCEDVPLPPGPVTPPPPPPPPAACVTTAPGDGLAAIDGDVFVNADPYDGLASWCVGLTGPVTATTATDEYGRFAFTGLPAGVYTVCEVLQSGWTEEFPFGSYAPSCPTGLGWQVVVDDNNDAYVSFGNIKATP